MIPLSREFPRLHAGAAVLQVLDTVDSDDKARLSASAFVQAALDLLATLDSTLRFKRRDQCEGNLQEFRLRQSYYCLMWRMNDCTLARIAQIKRTKTLMSVIVPPRQFVCGFDSLIPGSPCEFDSIASFVSRRVFFSSADLHRPYEETMTLLLERYNRGVMELGSEMDVQDPESVLIAEIEEMPGFGTFPSDYPPPTEPCDD